MILVPLLERLQSIPDKTESMQKYVDAISRTCSVYRQSDITSTFHDDLTVIDAERSSYYTLMTESERLIIEEVIRNVRRDNSSGDTA